MGDHTDMELREHLEDIVMEDMEDTEEDTEEGIIGRRSEGI